jgi:hypothetical protein
MDVKRYEGFLFADISAMTRGKMFDDDSATRRLARAFDKRQRLSLVGHQRTYAHRHFGKARLHHDRRARLPQRNLRLQSAAVRLCIEARDKTSRDREAPAAGSIHVERS